MRKIQLSFLLIAIGFLLSFIESSVLSFPLIFVFSTAIFLVFRNIKTGILVFILGLFADSFRVVNFGITPLFVFSTYALIFLYEKYFGRNDMFAILAIFIFAVIIYSVILSFSLLNIFLVILLLVFVWIAVSVFKFWSTKNK